MDLRPWQWTLLVAYVGAVAWALGVGRGRGMALDARRPPALIRHPDGEPLRLIVGRPGARGHAVHVWND